MSQQRLKDLINSRDKFIVTAEYVPLPGNRLSNIEGFLKGHAENVSLNDQAVKKLPDDVALAGVALPQSPGGIASMNPMDIYAILDKKDRWGDLDVIPHISTKDHNLDAIKSYLFGMQQMGIETVLALTGDKPVASKGVFDVESIGLIKYIKSLNCQSLEKAKPGEFDKAHQFYVAAAVSQYKYTEASQMQQYYKMSKKIKVGADCLITQLGYDWRKCDELFRYLKEEKIDIPVIGNVYVLTTMTPAPRLMYQGKLPGCVVTKSLFDTLRAESVDQHIERAAIQVAMFRDMGAVGVDLGGLMSYDMFLDIMNRADRIGSNWKDHKDKLGYGPEDGFYLYDEQGNRRTLMQPKPRLSKKSFDFFHNNFLEPGQGLHGMIKKTLGASKGLREGNGRLYKFVFSREKAMKTMLFNCEECGDCHLTENFGICSKGCCEKGIDNAPCGDANANGTCGNNPDIQCVGERIYEAAASEGNMKGGGLNRLANDINPRRQPELDGTASILNYLFEKDHTKKIMLIQIGENIHAGSPKPGAAMKELQAAGADAFEKPSGALDYIKSLVISQIDHNASFIAVNIDAIAQDDPQLAVDLMRKYVVLVKKYSRDVPVCIDSSNHKALEAGLEAWYQGSNDDIAMPLVNSVTATTIDEVLSLREKYAFKVIGLLKADQQAGGSGACSVDDLYNLARTIFDAATGKYGFQADDLFFNVAVTPLADDKSEATDVPSDTYRAFETISKIQNDSAMTGVHSMLVVADSVKKIPGRKIGVCRAYLAKAMEYGLDAAVVNSTLDYGLKPSAGDLLDLVDAFAKQDGTEKAHKNASELMDKFAQANRKVKK